MTTFTSFRASTQAPQDARLILQDYVALDRARLWRRLLTVRFGLLAFVAFMVGRLVHGLSLYGRWVPIGMCLVPPLWAAIVEARLAWRLSGRLESSDAASHQSTGYTVLTESDFTSAGL